MKLKTERLILRNPVINDVEDLVEGLNDIQISESLGFIPHPYTKKDALEWIEKNLDRENEKEGLRKEYDFAIELKSEKKLVGVVMLDSVDYFHGSARIGYWVNKNYWEQGIVTEANRKVLNFAFNKLNLRRVHLSAYVESEASNRVAKKLGFTLEGTLRQSHRTKATGKIHDTNTYGLLREEFQNLVKKPGSNRIK